MKLLIENCEYLVDFNPYEPYNMTFDQGYFKASRLTDWGNTTIASNINSSTGTTGNLVLGGVIGKFDNIEISGFTCDLNPLRNLNPAGNNTNISLNIPININSGSGYLRFWYRNKIYKTINFSKTSQYVHVRDNLEHRYTPERTWVEVVPIYETVHYISTSIS